MRTEECKLDAFRSRNCRSVAGNEYRAQVKKGKRKKSEQRFFFGMAEAMP
jgi:hypothetical protein